MIIWNVNSGEAIKRIRHSNFVHCVQFSPDNQFILSSSNDKTITLYDVQSKKVFKKFKGYSDHISCARFSPNGRFVVASLEDKTIRILDINSGKELKTLEGHSHFAKDVKYFSGASIVSCSNDGTICLWDAKSGDELQEFTIPKFICVDISPDGSKIALGCSDNTIQIWG
ncbi:ribosome assembly protein 4 (RSA4) [Reticulomyxa filosa]|uniref:Ribosome assembly protein 4 (RSA4) n=1 Tax=Reticulomyxa filosa TaxID=46433 RepID=X6LKJ5_RETFI|nr:ribosome assembly protein 4 (RSA4) [Reticulomyxa filosa]|eukprot:ETO01250.1 ribosome assembly protein 4 (RSA4) [Reticulomyxa filosa]